ncbi:MAG: tRNA-(ms[2]io[6]A)-hydroxylase [Saprospiraceae bacterium]|nr:tRNA-(ms[2]io[6]A)-hydroxylase [Saprospiraceae bacterium]|tara:strand:- start:1836 stop:2444 length:609 start_codon:yes stop_codon:yes gene_type:complete
MRTNSELKTKLGLKLPTDPRWVNLAEKELEDILTDHAYCEQKAASSCISIISQFSEYEKIVEELAPIVAEEWDHFRMVYQELRNRKLKLGKQRKDEYVNLLLKFQKKDGSKLDKLLDKLLTSAMIEARSCERFRLLSLHIKEDSLKSFYHEFMVSEAGHYKTFLNLAKEYCGQEKTLARWQEFLSYEAKIMNQLEPKGNRMH